MSAATRVAAHAAGDHTYCANAVVWFNNRRGARVHAYEHVPCLGTIERERYRIRPLCGARLVATTKVGTGDPATHCPACTAAVDRWHIS